jgi:hypothetical protein
MKCKESQASRKECGCPEGRVYVTQYMVRPPKFPDNQSLVTTTGPNSPPGFEYESLVPQPAWYLHRPRDFVRHRITIDYMRLIDDM